MTTETQTGTVYRIWSPNSPDCYVGATIQELCSRMSGHRAALKRWSADKTKLYCTSYEVLRFPDAKIEWLETVEFKTRAELTAREGHWIRTLDCVNKNMAGNTQAESNAQWYLKNREDKMKKSSAYKAAHRAEIAAHNGVNLECACGGRHTHGNTAVHNKTKLHQAYIAALPAII
jgi:GIY-YIG catalytic domain